MVRSSDSEDGVVGDASREMVAVHETQCLRGTRLSLSVHLGGERKTVIKRRDLASHLFVLDKWPWT